MSDAPMPEHMVVILDSFLRLYPTIARAALHISALSFAL